MPVQQATQPPRKKKYRNNTVNSVTKTSQLSSDPDRLMNLIAIVLQGGYNSEDQDKMETENEE